MATELGLGLEITELRLGLPGHSGGHTWMEKNEKKRVFSEIEDQRNTETCSKTRATDQVVGWPPVCSYRKKINGGLSGCEMTKTYVKVSMDGAPFLRKIDMRNYKGYSDLVMALEKLFDCLGLGEGLKDGDSSEYIPIYHDKDGDWMLVGDVPWEMFTETCKRLRIKKRSDGTIGIGKRTSPTKE